MHGPPKQAKKPPRNKASNRTRNLKQSSYWSPQTPNPYTLNPKTPKPQNLNPKTLKPKTLKPQNPKTLNPKTLKPQNP